MEWNCPVCHASVAEDQKFCPGCGSMLPAAAAAGDPLLGTVVAGKYRVVSLLGEGGMGAVFLAEQQLGTTTRKVALKTLHRDLSRDPKIKARFQREVGTVAELQHPNTIQVFDFGTTADDQLYIVMEFVQGANVADLLEKQGAMPPARVEAIIRQVCGSLEEAHGRGIVHRDLKPENIVLTDRAGTKDFVKVLDFGIAKRSTDEDPNEQKLTQQGMVLGTPPYMSPEQFTGAPIDARSDIYSLGVMAYEMLSGQLPFRANTAWEWATQHMQAQPIPLEAQPHGKAVPPAFSAAIARSMAKSPDDRFASVKEFADAISGATQSYTRAMSVSMPPNAPGGPGGPVGRTDYVEPMSAGMNARMNAGMNAGMMGGMQMEPPNLTAGLLGQQGMRGSVAPGMASVTGAMPGGPNVTPSAGNHAFPTPPIGVPGMPIQMAPGMPMGDGSYEPQAKSRAPLFAGIALLALLSGGAVVAATSGMFSHGTATAGAGSPVFDAAIPMAPPPTKLTAPVEPTPAPAPVIGSPAPVAATTTHAPTTAKPATPPPAFTATPGRPAPPSLGGGASDPCVRMKMVELGSSTYNSLYRECNKQRGIY